MTKNILAKHSIKSGVILIQTLIFAVIAVLFISGLTGWAGLTLKSIRQSENMETAIQVAESGVEYYRWHLAHAPQDFTDGTGGSGPYVHDYLDKDSNKVGEFSLEITPPPTGSTIVTIRSTGTITADPGISRIVEAKFAIPSWAKYAVAANDDMRFGIGTEVFGPIHSNKGIRFDGLAHNVVSSALTSYDDPDHSGGNEFAVHTHMYPTDPLPPNAVPARSDVFVAGRQFPVPAIDFNGLTADLAHLKTEAEASNTYFAASGSKGYQIIFKTNGTFDLYKVTSLVSPSSRCTNVSNQTNWGSWSINNKQFINNYNIPNNGAIFLGDHTWVEGQINNKRVTVGVGTFPDQVSTRKNIIINNDLLYTNYDGKDTIGLIAQNDITVGMVSDTNLKIDAALIAQNGRIGRFYYEDPLWGDQNCSPYHHRDSIDLYGIINTNKRYGFAYTDGTGYSERNIVYDANLLYAPPPSFPLASDQYQTISWQEIK